MKKYGTLKPEIMDLRMEEVREVCVLSYLRKCWIVADSRNCTSVPPAQLLEFRVQEGWEPLCAFLGLPVPDVPFPRVNDSASMNKLIVTTMLKGLFRWTVAVASFAASVFAVRRVFF